MKYCLQLFGKILSYQHNVLFPSKHTHSCFLFLQNIFPNEKTVQLEIFLMCHKVGPIVPLLLPFIPYLDVGQMENLHRKIIFSTFCNTNRSAGQTNEPSPKLLNSENFYNFEWVFQIFYLVIWLLLLRTNIIPWLKDVSTFTFNIHYSHEGNNFLTRTKEPVSGSKSHNWS